MKTRSIHGVTFLLSLLVAIFLIGYGSVSFAQDVGTGDDNTGTGDVDM